MNTTAWQGEKISEKEFKKHPLNPNEGWEVAERKNGWVYLIYKPENDKHWQKAVKP